MKASPDSIARLSAGRTRAAALCAIAGLFGWLPTEARAQALRLSSSNPVMRVEVQGESSTVVNTDTKIHWKWQAVPTKITVQTMCPGQSFGLTVRAAELTAGVSTGAVTLRDGMAPVDLIISIPAGGQNAQAMLLYQASATISQGNSDEEGLDHHVVTYTLVEQ